MHRFISRLGLVSLLTALISTFLVGCGGARSTFMIEVVPTAVSVVAGGATQKLTVVASPLNGFSDKVSIALSALPSGVTASPSSLSLIPGTIGQITLTASSSAAPGNASIILTGTSGSISQSATSVLTIAAPPPITTTATLSTFSFDFGDNLVNNTLAETVAVVTNTGTNTLTMSPVLSGDPSYSIVPDQSCGVTLAPSANCNMVVSYKPTAASTPNPQNAVLNMAFGDLAVVTPQTVAITGKSAALSAGIVTATNNPQVALYTMTLPFPGSMTIDFGTTTAYGLKTWAQSTDSAAGKVSIFVAGMKSKTDYHMAAAIRFSNGINATDADHTFTTGAVPASATLNVKTTTTTGLTPQPGLEMLNTLAELAISDLSGNILWTYRVPGNAALNEINGVKMLPNGNIVMAIGIFSTTSLTGPTSPSAVNEIREVNLAGDTVREISINDLNAELAIATCAECQVKLETFHHEITPLPNGHWLLLANAMMALSPTSKPPLTNAPAQNVLGDVIIDLDQSLQPVWVWNEFNHMDPNRHPMSIGDWTHTNAIVYSPDDGNILVSMRHQNWVVKVDYADGNGRGDILWHLGKDGDFTLQGGTDPTDWQYAQHFPAFFSANTTGVFSLGIMDNGNDRAFPVGVTCGSAGAPACRYSTVPIYKIDELGKTATLTFHQIAPASQYSSWGGSMDQLENGNVEYDLCGLATGGSVVYEVTQEENPQTVWTMTTGSTSFYRAFRIPSLYPNVQW